MRDQGMRDRYDVVIAGARVAGASTAMLLARAGLRVLAVDPLPRGRDTLSTHALMRGGVMQLAHWGVLDAIRAAGTPVARTTTFYYQDERIEIPIRPSDGVDGLYAPRRTVLDPILAESAEAAGATVVHGAAVSDLIRDSQGRVRGAVIRHGEEERTVHTDLVIGADGLRSKIARLVRAPETRSMSHAGSAIYGYWPDLGVDGFHWHYAPGAGIGVIPTNEGLACVFATVTPDQFAAWPHGDLAGLMRRTIHTLSPALFDAVAGVDDAVRLRAFAGVPGFLRKSVGPGWALVGDAGFFRDPFTAHGITDALREAEYLARAIVSPEPGALETWERERDERATDILEITDRICSFDWTMDEVKELHLELSRAMNVPVHGLREIHAARPDIRSHDLRVAV